MPYVQQNVRDFYDPVLDELIQKLTMVDTPPGDLNYIVSRLLGAAYKQHPSYETVNLLIGALTCAALEFYARIARPHEHVKHMVNGDVY